MFRTLLIISIILVCQILPVISADAKSSASDLTSYEDIHFSLQEIEAKFLFLSEDANHSQLPSLISEIHQELQNNQNEFSKILNMDFQVADHKLNYIENYIKNKYTSEEVKLTPPQVNKIKNDMKLQKGLLKDHQQKIRLLEKDINQTGQEVAGVSETAALENLVISQIREKLTAIEALLTQWEETAADQAPPSVEHEMDQLWKKLEEREKLLKVKEFDLKQLRTNIHSLTEKIQSLESDYQEKSDKLKRLTEELTALSLNAVEKDRMISQREEDIRILNGHLDDLEERLSLVQKIIQEKDQHIDQLANNFDRLNQGQQQQLKTRKNKILSMKKNWEHLEEQYHVSLMEKTRYLNDLERLIYAQDKRLDQVDDSIIQKQVLVNQLTQFLKRKEKTLQHYDQTLTYKNKEMDQLNGILEIYQWKLSEEHHVSRQMAQRVKILEQQLASRREFPEREKNVAIQPVLEEKLPSLPFPQEIIAPRDLSKLGKNLTLDAAHLKQKMSILLERLKNSYVESDFRENYILALESLLMETHNILDSYQDIFYEQQQEYIRLAKRLNQLAYLKYDYSSFRFPSPHIKKPRFLQLGLQDIGPSNEVLILKGEP